MHSYFDLTTQSHYRIQQFMAEAEHDRLVSESLAHSPARRSGGRRQRRLALGALAAGLLCVGSLSARAAPAPESASAVPAAVTADVPEAAGS